MLKITVEGNEKEIEGAKDTLENACFLSQDCKLGITCEECEKGRVEIKYVVKEDKYKWTII